MKRAVLVVLVLALLAASLISCGYSKNYVYKPPSGLLNRVAASQGVTSTFTFGGLVLIDGRTDSLPRTSELSAGSSPGLMVLSPTRNILAVVDAGSNSVFTVNTVTEASLGRVQLPAPTTSIVVPTADQVGYAAVPTASVNGFSFLGAVEVMNFGTGAIATTIGVTNAKTVVSNAAGTQLLVFSNDSDSLTLLSPANAVPPVDTSCFTAPPNAVCTIVQGFSRPVFAILNGNTAYVLNCGLQCGGNPATTAAVCGAKPACITVLDLGSLTITNTIPVDAATMAFLKGTTLYVAGTSPTDNACTGQTTAAATCGRLDIVDLTSMTAAPGIVVTDGYHDRMDMSVNGQLFIGSHDCTNVGNVNTPSGEVRGCLSIYNTNDASVVIPPDNGDVTGLQGFTHRNVEYVAEGGALRVYDTTKNVLLIDDFLPQGSINIVGYVGDVKAIDFF